MQDPMTLLDVSSLDVGLDEIMIVYMCSRLDLIRIVNV